MIQSTPAYFPLFGILLGKNMILNQLEVDLLWIFMIRRSFIEEVDGQLYDQKP